MRPNCFAKTNRIFLLSNLPHSLLVLWVTLSSCQSYRVDVSSTPESAEVFIYRPDTKAYQSLGKTPLTIESEQLLVTSFFQVDMMALLVSKPGYVPHTVVIDKSENPKFSLNVNLDALSDWGATSSNEAVANLSPVADRALKTLRSIDAEVDSGQIQRALDEAKKLQTEFPEAPIVWDVLGSLNLRIGQEATAISCYRRSLELDPNNQSTAATLRSLEGKAK